MNLEHVACNACGNDDVEFLFEQRDSLTDFPAPFTVVKCKHCGLVYLNPRPSIDDIQDFYPATFFSYQLEAPTAERLSLRERLLAVLTRSSARQRVDFVQKLLKPDAGLEVLDVGCGKGSFLFHLRQRFGCRVTGMDFDDASLRYCREVLHISALRAGADSGLPPDEKYDLITMWHYLEHEFDPLSVLVRANGSLKAGHLLIVEVPNAESLENRIFKKRSYLYDVPRHLYGFSPATMSTLIGRAGFGVEQITFPWFAGGWIGSVQSVLFGGRVYKDLKGHIFVFMLLSLLCFPIEYVLSRTGKGSIMRVVARKTSDVGSAAGAVAETA
jgi:SAM-dependent methyltransferase